MFLIFVVSTYLYNSSLKWKIESWVCLTTKILNSCLLLFFSSFFVEWNVKFVFGLVLMVKFIAFYLFSILFYSFLLLEWNVKRKWIFGLFVTFKILLFSFFLNFLQNQRKKKMRFHIRNNVQKLRKIQKNTYKYENKKIHKKYLRT